MPPQFVTHCHPDTSVELRLPWSDEVAAPVRLQPYLSQLNVELASSHQDRQT